MKPAILSESNIEQRAEAVLAQYEQQTGKTITFPVPIEKVALQILDLSIEYDSLPPLRDGREAVSKFRQPRFGIPAGIVVNVDLVDTLFRTCPGLERTGIGHETGHGDLHIERGRIHQLDFGFDDPPDFMSSTSTLDNLLDELVGQRGPVGDDGWREWQAHTFMRYVLMPRRLLLPLLDGGGYLRWPGPGGLYDLRDQCGVTISALVVHLKKLGYIAVDDQKQIHDLRSAQKSFST